MNNFAVKINLTQLNCVTREFNGKEGKVKCIVIPIKENNLFQGEKGVYLDLSGIALKDPKYPKQQTHLIKQNLPKEIYTALSDDEKKALPIIGNGLVFAHREPEQKVSEVIDASAETDDLPF